MAKLLKLEKRADWRGTVQTTEEEEEDKEGLRELFGAYDTVMPTGAS